MIRNGYYFPEEIFKHLKHIDSEGNIKGDAAVGISFGSRTAGKTVGFIVKLLEEFYSTGRSFILLSRTKDQINEGYLEKWFRKFYNIEKSKDPQTNIMLQKIKSSKVDFSKDTIKVDEKILAYCVPLTLSRKVKDQCQFDRVGYIIFDEAVQLGENTLWIMGQPAIRRIYDISVTAARGYEDAMNLTNLVFIFNVSDYDNWIFSEYNIEKFFNKQSKFSCQKGIVIEKVDNEIKNDKILKSTLGRVIASGVIGSEYLETNINNKYTDNDEFVKKRGLDFTKLTLQFAIHDKILGIFKFSDYYHIAIIDKSNKSRIICKEPELHTADVTLEFNNQIIDVVLEAYIKKMVTFHSQSAKNLFLEFVGL